MSVALKRKLGRKMDQTQKQKLGFLPHQEAIEKKKKKKKYGNDECQKKAKRYPLVSYHELPEYMKDNEFILNHYRADWPLKIAFFSIFRWHNETLNVWTHLIGFVLFLGLTLANLVQVPQVADLLGLFTRSVLTGSEKNVSHNSKDFSFGTTELLDLNHITPSKMEAISGIPVTQWPFYIFLGGSMFCLLSSSVCHLFSCHSRNLNIYLLRVDYVGIAIMIITSFFPPIYYIFQCDHLHWQFIYLGGITTMGIFTIVTLLSPSLSTGKYRAFRAVLFCSMGLFGLVPAIHASIVNWTNPKRNIILAYESSMALFYLTGTVFYVSRVPERLKPGWFDLAGHSHQIFHVFVVFGALAHYGAALVFLDYRHRVGCELNQ